MITQTLLNLWKCVEFEKRLHMWSITSTHGCIRRKMFCFCYICLPQNTLYIMELAVCSKCFKINISQHFMKMFQNKCSVFLWEIYESQVVDGYGEEWCREFSGHIIKRLRHVDLQQVSDVPAFVIHHLLHPTNSLITHWKRLIREAPQLTISADSARSGRVVYRYEDGVSLENFLRI